MFAYEGSVFGRPVGMRAEPGAQSRRGDEDGFRHAVAGFGGAPALVGVRSVHGWSWGRSLAAVALAAALPALIVLASVG